MDFPCGNERSQLEGAMRLLTLISMGSGAKEAELEIQSYDSYFWILEVVN